MIKYFLVLAAVLFGTISYAQMPDTLWTKTFGGSSEEVGYCVQQTRDGGYITVGYTSSYGAGGSDVYLCKMNAGGIKQWTRTFGGSGSERGYSVQQTTDGGYIIAGYTWSFGAGEGDVYLIKTDASGNEQWSNTYGASGEEGGYGVQQTLDGGYIIVGYTESFGASIWDVYLIKTDSSGNEQWSRTYSGSYSDYGRCVQQTRDGGYIIAGYTYFSVASGWNMYLIKTDDSGNQEWSQSFGGSGGDLAYSVQQTEDGGYIIAGYTSSYGAGEHDVYVIKTTLSGVIEWTQTYGGSSDEVAYCAEQTDDGGYIIAGNTNTYGAGAEDAYLIKADSTGNEIWSQTIGGTSNDFARWVQQTSDGGYIITGYTSSYGAGGYDMWLIRLKPAGGYPDVNITLMPITWPIQIPPAGGSFDFYAFVTNNQGEAVSLDLWIDALLPDSAIVYPLAGPFSVTLNTGTTGWYRIQNVPASAPAGIYMYNAYAGLYPASVWSMNSFDFEKLETGDGVEVSGWMNYGDGFEIWLNESVTEAPNVFILLGNYPNPFNPITTISYNLPEATEVALTVYDVSGRQVAILVDEYRQEGSHKVTFDAYSLSSGVYLYQLKAGDLNTTGKMVLMK